MGNVTRKAAVQNGKSKAATLVDEAIQTNPVVIFSKTYCPYCQSAKSNIRSALKKIANAPKPEIFELDRMGSLGYQIQNYLAQVTGRHTVPNVFIGGSSVGGGDDIAAYARRGVLVQMLTQAPQRLVHQFPERFEPEKKPDTAAEAVERAIKDNAVMVFSKSYCPFCTSAKDLLQERIAAVEGLNPINVFELDEMGTDGAAMQQYLFQKTGERTVPNIFIAGKHVGGSDDVHGLDARNELIPMLTSAAASVSSPAATEVLSAEEEQTETDTALPADVVSEEKPKTETKEIVFGAGCFWGVELAFQRVAGVLKTEVGYSNGKMSRVTYDAICTGATGSAEVVRVWYDPSVLFLKQLLEVWESRHDPTSLNKQGNDQGTQYRSAIYYSDEEQAEEVRRWISEASTRHTKEIVTEVAAIKNYCAAEEYHQRYLEKKGQSAEKGSSASIRCYG